MADFVKYLKHHLVNGTRHLVGQDDDFLYNSQKFNFQYIYTYQYEQLVYYKLFCLLQTKHKDIKKNKNKRLTIPQLSPSIQKQLANVKLCIHCYFKFQFKIDINDAILFQNADLSIPITSLFQAAILSGDSVDKQLQDMQATFQMVSSIYRGDGKYQQEEPQEE